MLINDPPVQISSRLWMLGSNAFPVYLYRDESDGTVFEGSVSAMGPVLDGQLQSLGIAKEEIRRLVVTHAHPDHVMAIPVFRKMFADLEVIASEPAAKTLQIEKAVSFFGKMDGALTRWLSETGVIDANDRQDPLGEKRIAVDRIVHDGDRIEVGRNMTFRVLETPGHSDCSLSFHEPDENVLIISDATGYYLPDQEFMWPGYLAGYADYLQSIERLAGIGAEVLCLSHNAVIQGREDVTDYFRRSVTATEQYHERIISQAKAGESVQSIAAQLGSEIYERTGQLTLDFFQKNCALLVKHSLQHAGMDGSS